MVAAGIAPAAVDGYPTLERPFDAWHATGLLDLAFASLAKWDALHYTAISIDGYSGVTEGFPSDERRAAFFPLYPGLVRVLSGFAASPGAALIVAYAVSLACFLAALTLLHRLAEIELGPATPGRRWCCSPSSRPRSSSGSPTRSRSSCCSRSPPSSGLGPGAGRSPGPPSPWPRRRGRRGCC
ncbi:MAG TPA: hypothetical protein VHF50_05025 [Solirubrobacterales bacterium]|nr:hypothetical protein [Solirubrobacterales bacterium]